MTGVQTCALPIFFSPAEIRDAIKQDRVFCLSSADGVVPDEYLEHQLVVFPDVHSRWVIADGWHVNVRGQVHPDEHVPVPIGLGDVSHLDFAHARLRLPLLAYAEGAVNEDTRAACEILSSRMETWKALHKAGVLPLSGCPTAQAFERAVRPAARKVLIDSEIDLRAIDWAEVASCFDVADCPSFQEIGRAHV